MSTYRCDNCDDVFEYVDGWGDDEALAESLATFGFVPAPEDAAVLCDGCWKRFMPWARENGLVVDDG